MKVLQFETTDKLHESERSTIYRTRHIDGQPAVILKILKGRQKQTLARFRQEFEVARELQGPSVISIQRLEPFEGTLLGVLEDFDGKSLNDGIEHNRPAVRDALGVAISICRGLADIHSRGVIHRNLCPANVLWSRATGEIKIIDFGLASRLERTSTSPQSPQVLEGTLSYMSPEQTGRMNRPVDFRTDLYSMGMVFYELFTGIRPFESDDPLEIIHGHIARQAVAPDQLQCTVPQMISRIVLKLLEKNAEDRYQSAGGAGHDLIECARQLDTQGVVHPFSLATQDIDGRFQISAKLYGRATDVAHLVSAFEKVLAGEMVFTLVAGHSGVGKSSLVQELYRPLAVARGRYIAGKYDQYERSVPYGAVGLAFNALCDQLLCEPRATLDRWQARILKAVGKNGRVLTEVISHLEWIIGEQPAVPESDVQSAQNLFLEVCQDFVQEICRPEEPLVLFVDDLQWADIASLALLQALLKNPRIRGLHLIGAYRNNEVDSSHPLLLLLDDIQNAGVNVSTIQVANLSLENVATLIADTLLQGEEEATSLAHVIHSKTHGNAFFTAEFLKALHTSGLLTFHREQRLWVWDSDQIRARQITDNVVELMAGRIRQLPDSSQVLIRLAACIGGFFDLMTLAIISRGKENPQLVLDALEPAIQLGVIVRLDEGQEHPEGTTDFIGACRFRFQHDRVQQAAYSLIPALELPKVHFDMARQLLEVSAGGEMRVGLFQIVNYLWKGASLLLDPAERIRAARLGLQAGLKARKASAHHASLDYFRMAQAFLPEDAFQSDYQLAFDIHVGLAKSCSIAGEFPAAEALYPFLLERAGTAMDKVRVHTVQMHDYHLQGSYERAIGVQKAALLMVGETVPSSDQALAAAVDSEVKLNVQFLAGRTIADLENASEVASPQVVAALKILMNMWISAYLLSREGLVQWTSVRLANLSLQHGNSEVAAFAFVQFGYLCVVRRKNFEEAYQYGQVAVKLADRYDSLEMRGRIYFLFAIFISLWTKPLSASMEVLRKAYLFSVEAGDWTYATYAGAQMVLCHIITGVPCDEAHSESQKYFQFLKGRAPEQINSFFLTSGYCALLNLQGKTRTLDSFDCEFLDERRFDEAIQRLPTVETWLHGLKLRNLYLHRCFQAGAGVIVKAEDVAKAVPGQILIPEELTHELCGSAPHHGCVTAGVWILLGQ